MGEGPQNLWGATGKVVRNVISFLNVIHG